MKHKFTTTFNYVITAKDIKKFSTSLFSSKASLEKLSKLVPWVDFEKNTDLFGIGLDLTIVNAFNKNGDGVDSKVALRMLSSFIDKPINIEHDRSQIVGHIARAEFQDMTFRKYLDYYDIQETIEPFYMSVGGVIYKLASEGFTKIMQAIVDGQVKGEEISGSWEVGFDEYYAAVGNSNLLKDCRIVTNEKEVENLSKYMKGFGGSGVNESGERVFRLIAGESAMGLGLGLTTSPAADVEGVYVIESFSKEKTSQIEKANVIKDVSGEKMTKEEILALIKGEIASVKDEGKQLEAVASVSEKIASAIIQSDKKFKQEKEEAEAKTKLIEAEAETFKKKVTELESQIKASNDEIKTTKEKLEALETEKKVALAKESFNARMEKIDSTFEFSKEDKEIVAKQVAAIESDESFASYFENLQILSSTKTKEAIKAKEEALATKVQEELKKELEKRGIKDPLEGKKPEGEVPPNNVAEASNKEGETIMEKFAAAFSKEKVKITV